MAEPRQRLCRDLLGRHQICRDFLDTYDEKIYSELLPRIFEIGILYLCNNYHTLAYTLEQRDDYICQLKFEGQNQSKIPSYQPPPPPEYVEEPSGLLKLKQMPDNTLPAGKSSTFYATPANFSDEVYINYGNNFFDENYYIPHGHCLRNDQLYWRRIKNPKFTTQNKNIYPHWWWNLRGGEEVDLEEEEDSYYEHRPNHGSIQPRSLEKDIRRKRNKSLRNLRVPGFYEESKIFPGGEESAYFQSGSNFHTMRGGIGAMGGGQMGNSGQFGNTYQNSFYPNGDGRIPGEEEGEVQDELILPDNKKISYEITFDKKSFELDRMKRKPEVNQKGHNKYVISGSGEMNLIEGGKKKKNQ